MLTKVKSMDKSEIRDDLRRQILLEKYIPGEFLIERDLCDLYGVSRTPMREILFALVNTGLIVKDRGKGFSVRKLDLKLLFEVFETRESIESMAARLCAQRYTVSEQVHFELLKEKLESSETADDPDQIIVLGRELHQLIIEATGNTIIQEFNEKLSNLAWLISTATKKVKSLESESRIQHIRIIDSILSNDPDLSEQLMREHIQHTFQALIQASAPKYSFHLNQGKGSLN